MLLAYINNIPQISALHEYEMKNEHGSENTRI